LVLWLVETEAFQIPHLHKHLNVMGNNKMTHSNFFVALILSLYSCGQHSNLTKHHIDTNQKIAVENEEWTIYSKEDTIIHVKRLLSSNSILTLLSYDINTSTPEAAKQIFINSKTLANNDEVSFIKLQNLNFNWTPLKDTPTLFVQIDWSAFKYDLEPWDKREAILDNIEKDLQVQGHGEWIGCDVGNGGLNMLFEVEEIEKAIPIILEVVSEAGFAEKTTIGRRINTVKDDWFYEVIYPLNYSGVFLTM
jgi:hypothetical protein